MKNIQIEIGTNVLSTSGSNISLNTNNSELTNSNFKTAIEPGWGANLSTNLPAVTIPPEVELTISSNSLSKPGYVWIDRKKEYPDMPGIADANYRAGRNNELNLVNEDNLYRISGYYNDGESIGKLKKPAILRIDYLDADSNGIVDTTDNISVKDLQLYRYDDGEKRWKYVGEVTISEVSNYVELEIEEFGIYTLMGDSGTKDFGESLILYPNPFNPANQKMIIRFHMPKSGTAYAKVYTITGRLVRILLDGKHFDGPKLFDDIEDLSWDGKNGMGKDVVNGIYIIGIRVKYDDGSEEPEKILPLGVLR